MMVMVMVRNDGNDDDEKGEKLSNLKSFYFFSLLADWWHFFPVAFVILSYVRGKKRTEIMCN